MKSVFKNILYSFFSKLPGAFLEKIVEKNMVDIDEIEKLKIEKYAFKLMNDFEGECKKIVLNKKVMEIDEGYYSYTYFNVCYLNNMMGLILYSLYQGCIPYIKVNAEQSDKYNNWEWYFIQPLELDIFKECQIKDCEIIKCDRKGSPFSPSFNIAFDLESTNYEIWNFLYKKFVYFNERTSNYINEELKMLLQGKTLGTLIRGTDYVALKPKGHPIQPDINTLISLLKKEIKEEKYEYVYVATEEKRLFEMISTEIGEKNVLSNNRVYYDDKYYGEQLYEIGNVHFERENDNYLKGLEYLSSLTILANCDGLIGGNCGGMLYAVLMRNVNDGRTKVINCGVYS